MTQQRPLRRAHKNSDDDARREARRRPRRAPPSARSRRAASCASPARAARDFLHRMSTQHLSALPPGRKRLRRLPRRRGGTSWGRGSWWRAPDDLLFVTEPEEVAILLPHLRKYVLAAPVKIEDASASLAVMAVLGPRGIELARGAAGRGDRGRHAAARGSGRRGDRAAGSALAGLRAALLAAGAADLDAADLEALRIEEGVARFGADMDGERLPMEAALTRDAIHFQKGCYLGQEVVLRATVRGADPEGARAARAPGRRRAGDPPHRGGQGGRAG